MLHNESMEMYLETILRLCKSNEKVRAVDIANQMRISKVSVCHAIKNLQAKDYAIWNFLKHNSEFSLLCSQLLFFQEQINNLMFQ